MKQKAIVVLTLAVAGISALTGRGYRYEDYSQGRSFFAEGQEWKFTRHGVDGTAAEYEVTAKLVGDTTISSYMEYGGEYVRVDQPCKSVRVVSEDPQVPEKRYAVYEWDAEVYVYSDKTKEFVQMLTFNKTDGVMILYNSEKWQVGQTDYIYPESRLLKRCALSAKNSQDRASVWVYRVGADRLWLSETKWENPGYLQLVSYYDPKDEVTYTSEVFESDTFVPDNLYYPDGKEWVYSSAYYEKKGDPGVYVHQNVESSEEFEHVECKRVSYALEGRESGETALVCSHDGVMYERGYMGMLTPRFDFRLEVGDRALEDVPDSEVAAADVIEVNGEIRRRLTFKGLAAGSEWKYWVEGIGANAGNDMMPREEMDDLSEIYYPGTFVRCDENGETKFSDTDFNTDPAGAAPVVMDADEDGGRVYRIDGVCVRGLQPGAIVIKSGRKYLLR